VVVVEASPDAIFFFFFFFFFWSYKVSQTPFDSEACFMHRFSVS